MAFIYSLLLSCMFTFVTSFHPSKSINQCHTLLFSKPNTNRPISPKQMELKRLSFIAKLVATGSLSLFIKPIASFAASSGKRVTSEEMAGLKGFQTKSGLKFVDLLDGIPNTKPKYGQLVTFHYNGYFRPAGGGDLELFDSSYLENQPYLIKHGNSRLIRGLDEAIHTMNIGGKRRAIIPNSLGYKEIGLGPVPITPARRKRLGELIDKLVADQGELVFDIDLLMVADDENDQGYYEDEAIDDEVLRQYIRKNTKFKDAEVE